jgi:uncharacterized membrane protein
MRTGLLPDVNSRIASVDALRGLIMIIMALDHVRDFFHSAANQFRPEDLTRTTPAIFFTRWITHFCAPVFMFTAGMGAYFWLQRGHTKAELSAFLIKRGVWLAILDLTVIRIALSFGAGPLLLTVLWGLGWAMIILAALVHLPIRAIAILSIATIALHSFLFPLSLPGLHETGAFEPFGWTVRIVYTPIPWFAVMSAGFCFGEIFMNHKRWIAPIGLALTAAFLILRVPRTTGVLSFLNVTKQPPSLDFVLMTLGPALILLALFDKMTFAPANPLLIFGRVPLFYFVAHLYLIHFLALAVAWPTMINPVAGNIPQGYGYSLPVTYGIWIAVVAALYPLCLWYARLKQRRRNWWLSYL